MIGLQTAIGKLPSNHEGGAASVWEPEIYSLVLPACSNLPLAQGGQNLMIFIL